MKCKLKRIWLAIIGVLLISHSIFIWEKYFQNQISLFDNGPAAAFIIDQISALCHLINIVFFLLGLMALLKTAFPIKSKT